MTAPRSPSALHPLFRAPPILLDLVQKGETITVPAHTTLFEEGDPVKHVYCVAEGTLVWSRYSVTGERQILTFVFPGDFVGITFEKNYTLGAETLSECTLLKMSHKELEKHASQDPEVWRAICEVMWRYLRGSLELTFTIGRKSAVARIASFLVYLSLRQGGFHHGVTHITLPMSRQDIGDLLGLTIETVSRSFTRLKNSGCITVPSLGEVDVIDVKGLRETAESSRPLESEPPQPGA